MSKATLYNYTNSDQHIPTSVFKPVSTLRWDGANVELWHPYIHT